MQNRTHIKNLKPLVGEETPLFSVIVFSERCTLKSVSVKSVNVVKRDDLYDLILKLYNNSSDILDENTISELYGKLYPYTQVTEEEKIKHIEDIKSNLGEE